MYKPPIILTIEVYIMNLFYKGDNRNFESNLNVYYYLFKLQSAEINKGLTLWIHVSGSKSKSIIIIYLM